MENSISDEIWTLRILCCPIRTHKRASDVSNPSEPYTVRILGRLCDRLFGRHTDIFRNTGRTRTTGQESTGKATGEEPLTETREMRVFQTTG